MTYQCRDCSYKRNGKFPNGCCPACGSFNITGGPKLSEGNENKSRAKTWRLVLSIALWVYLAVLVYLKFQG